MNQLMRKNSQMMKNGHKRKKWLEEENEDEDE